MKRESRLAGPLTCLALAGAALWGCSDSVVEVGRELSLEIDGPATLVVSDSLQVSYEARGRSLLGLVVRYGDGARDSVFFQGAQSAGGRVSHRYEEPGTYLVTGVVQDGLEGSTMAEFSVTVTP